MGSFSTHPMYFAWMLLRLITRRQPKFTSSHQISNFDFQKWCSQLATCRWHNHLFYFWMNKNRMRKSSRVSHEKSNRVSCIMRKMMIFSEPERLTQWQANSTNQFHWSELFLFHVNKHLRESDVWHLIDAMYEIFNWFGFDDKSTENAIQFPNIFETQLFTESKFTYWSETRNK